jgi:glycine/D-amino acid oxidase-like deaminating enzyme
LSNVDFDAIVIGAGFFGSAIAYHLATKHGMTVNVIEAESVPLSKASAVNQARIHNGYHYPRSLQTAYASRSSYDRFKSMWPSAVFSNFVHLYAVAKYGSKISANQFESTMLAISAPLRRVTDSQELSYFNEALIDAVFEVQEEAFNYLELRNWAYEVFNNSKVETNFLTKVESCVRANGNLTVRTDNGTDFKARYVFNVTYAGLDKIVGLQDELETELLHQLTSMALVEMPESFDKRALTIMDGPFFSLMPYPSLSNLYSFSHVRYTKRHQLTGKELQSGFGQNFEWVDEQNPFELMRLDAQRYVPGLAQVTYRSELRQIKTLLKRSTSSDSRPILFHKHKLDGAYSVLGAKLDNVFDALAAIDMELGR